MGKNGKVKEYRIDNDKEKTNVLDGLKVIATFEKENDAMLFIKAKKVADRYNLFKGE